MAVAPKPPFDFPSCLEDRGKTPFTTASTHRPTSSDRSLRYPGNEGERDLRIDFIRGIVLFVLVVIHVDMFSLYNLIVWERIGCISGGEGFVILSGFVVGMVYHKKLDEHGWQYCAWKLVDRAIQLYRVHLCVIASIALLSFVPFIDTHSVMSFSDRGVGVTYPLYPAADAPWYVWVAQGLLLKIGPHQFQVIGLYVVLLLLSPFALWLLQQNRPFVLLSISWICYFANWVTPSMPTGAQFEYAFPVLAWQFIYFHGMTVGFYRDQIASFMSGPWRRPILLTCGILFLGFMFFAWNAPNPFLPDYVKLSVIPADLFNEVYATYFRKDDMGLLRVVNYLVALVVGYWTLTRFWRIFERTCRWFFVPLGQATLYVFIVHIYFVTVISNIPILSEDRLVVNTLGHTLVLLVLWYMVRKQLFYRWIPR